MSTRQRCVLVGPAASAPRHRREPAPSRPSPETDCRQAAPAWLGCDSVRVSVCPSHRVAGADIMRRR
ncbi:MAG: hypothetical protein AVDCRST_MAG20-2949 [uncultured Acidimicrobiales bacterium]|uniref:Uncharacterized protein n=1 Tax=uncultured Acidimicrobiales bacterium TaxID=310071 RepID=A0A6J4IYK7_9ACTN|nr:MAG: hypothetical protein AVDCRST_MAG20-2949 [uncultured Acidimicrobiales bacterium]